MICIVHILIRFERTPYAIRTCLKIYCHILYDEFESKNCFYCRKPLKENAIHVDHFIPWSFIKDDQLWNFVLACPKCNESKRDKLPSEFYLERIIERNTSHRILKYSQFLTNYRSQSMKNIYLWAITNGYNNIWIPTQKSTTV